MAAPLDCYYLYELTGDAAPRFVLMRTSLDDDAHRIALMDSFRVRYSLPPGAGFWLLAKTKSLVTGGGIDEAEPLETMTLHTVRTSDGDPHRLMGQFYDAGMFWDAAEKDLAESGADCRITGPCERYEAIYYPEPLLEPVAYRPLLMEKVLCKRRRSTSRPV